MIYKSPQELEREELEAVTTAVQAVKLDAKVWQFRSGYGYEIVWDGGEQCAAALVSWGQDGTARLAIARTSVDGGPAIREREFGHRGNYDTPEALAKAIAENL